MATTFQTNGVLPATNGSVPPASQPDRSQTPSVPAPASQAQAPPASQPSQPSQGRSSQQPPAPPAAPPPPQQQQQQPTVKPRDVRTMELLLTAQGVTAYEARVPQLLLDFAYRHTSAILSDALHLSADPYTSHAGARPSGTAGATASVPAAADAAVSANAIQLAIASRLAFQFRGGAGGPAVGGGPSKDWLLELARERNRVALPRVGAVEWGARLPSERFVLSGVGWGLRDAWASGAADGDYDYDDEEEDVKNDGDVAMGDVAAAEDEDVGGDGVEGGTMGDVFADDGMEDEEMGME